MNYNQNKILFNYILDKTYIIKKDNSSNNILYITFDNNEIKCKYLLLFILKDNKILWSFENNYIDPKTKKISLLIKDIINKKFKIIDNNKINEFLKYLLKEINYIIYENEKINFLWSIKGNIKNYKQIYIITEILYL